MCPGNTSIVYTDATCVNIMPSSYTAGGAPESGGSIIVPGSSSLAVVSTECTVPPEQLIMQL